MSNFKSILEDQLNEAQVSKKTFVAFAKLLKRIKPKLGEDLHRELVIEVADIFQTMNPQFNFDRFAKAANVDEPGSEPGSSG